MVDLNLARRPFLNVKPVRRVGALLVLIGVALAGWSGWLYWNYFTGKGRARQESQELGRSIAAGRQSIADIEAQLGTLDLDTLNRRARAVNFEIKRRRFAWSRLFDHLSELLPPDVRLVSLSPDFSDRDSRSRRASPDEVKLELRGVAEGGEDILALLDALFTHPAFRDPNLSREDRRQDGLTDFVLEVSYLREADGTRRFEPLAHTQA